MHEVRNYSGNSKYSFYRQKTVSLSVAAKAWSSPANFELRTGSTGPLLPSFAGKRVVLNRSVSAEPIVFSAHCRYVTARMTGVPGVVCLSKSNPKKREKVPAMRLQID